MDSLNVCLATGASRTKSAGTAYHQTILLIDPSLPLSEFGAIDPELRLQPGQTLREGEAYEYIGFG